VQVINTYNYYPELALLDMDDVALLVMSCDKYSSAWYPFFELIKKYWPEHPQKVYLSSETRGYACQGIDIRVINSRKVEPWSKRLCDVLETIEEDYIIFSLEDFFLLGNVDNSKILQCLDWMRNDKTLAECRLSTFETITAGEIYKGSEFRVCPPEHGYRVDTQFAIWRKSVLISILNPTETPWQFEGRASDRSRTMTEKLLWFSPANPNDLSSMIMPYYNGWTDGYGIGWGKWRPKNKQWFESNGIKGVKYFHLGTLSEKDIDRRNRYLYVNPGSLSGKIIKNTYKFMVYADRLFREFMITGIHGIRNILCIMKSRKM